ncbi:MAG: M4 family metallopeptidase [Thermoleophilia bacterium]|nr:M4 family metallopeptidase [Thermoleophilia bacterium]
MRVDAHAAGARLTGTTDLHGPPHIHAPPAASSPMPAIHAGRLTVAVARPFDPGDSPMDGLRVDSLAVRPDGTTGDVLADKALRTAATVDAYLATRLGRNGVDGRGGRVELVVHAPDRTNAYWDATKGRIELGDGDGVEWGPFGSSLSVVAHELYHGVIDAEVKLDYEQPEQAAIHESLADVFAAGVTGSWRIGEDVITPGKAGDVIRDMSHPEVANLKQAAKAGGEAHALAGIASLAAVRTAGRIGMQDTERVWYQALIDHLPDGAGFRETARATIAAAAQLHPTDSSFGEAVRQAWESVGVLVD